jgi:ABC-type Zn uptake system ZnuABC Zn-binding protein ZnuA
MPRRPSRRPVASFVAAVSVALALAACGSDGNGGPAANDDLVDVVTTVSPITNIVENIGGEHVSIVGIVPEGTNSHTFEPAPSDAAVMEDADIVFMNGLHLEEPTRDLAETNLSDGAPLVLLGDETIGPDEYVFDFSFPEEQELPNPHLWTNPPYAERYAEIVKDELSALDPENAASYEANYEAFAARIDELDAVARQVTETVPSENRKLLTYHDSFPYFAREYGWEVIGAIQPSSFSEPTPQELAGLIDQIREQQVPAIFGSEVFPSPALEQIARETGAEYVDDLRDDDLPGEHGDPDHSYLGLMVFDYRTFMGALGGDPSAFDGFDVSNLHDDVEVEYRT